MRHLKLTSAFLTFSMLVGFGLFLTGCGGGSGETGETFITDDELQKQEEEQAAARANYDPPAP